MRKPPISVTNQAIRLAWAQEHLTWNDEDWKRVLWTDETWVNPGRHTKTRVTRKPGEEWDNFCVINKI